jgi:hypothetical protein
VNRAHHAVVSAIREDRGRFAALRGKRVLIYWPHGLGDWLHFAAVLPLLEPSNRYAITRFGDDYVSLMEESAVIQAISSGVRVAGDGGELGARHLGLTLRQCNGRRVTLTLPDSLADAVLHFAPEVLFWSDYPETEGRTAYPFHTKARNLARLLVPTDRLAGFDLSMPLSSAIDFTPPASTQRLLDERLARFSPPESRLCVISRTGVTASRKNWGDGTEAREFVAALQRGARDWRAVSMENESISDGVAGFRTLFGDIDEPFARVFKALLRRTNLLVGIPAGPLHGAMARGGIPTVGLWLAHHPDWYDEPNRDAIHLVGRYVRDRGFDRRPATTTKPTSLRHRVTYLETYGVSGDVVAEAARALTT